MSVYLFPNWTFQIFKNKVLVFLRIICEGHLIFESSHSQEPITQFCQVSRQVTL